MELNTDMDKDRINFTVNGVKCIVGDEASSTLMLVDYLRNVLELRGTKYMCREGGCGACIVSVSRTPDSQPMAVNSCLVSVPSCEGWKITTVEKVGNRLDGYHELQKTLTKYSGTQCGHCTPGWIMAMYSLLKQKKDLTKLEIEKSFGSNICRCTGYRPILEAFKTFAKDSENITDIEDLNLCKKSEKNCRKPSCDSDWCFLSKHDVFTPNNITIKLKDGKYWYTVYTVKDVFEVLSKEGDDSYMLVFGNTGKGAYPIDEYPRVLIDISKVSELKGSEVDQNLIIGAGNTLTELLDILHERANDEDFQYLNKLHDHITLIAHNVVRNLATIGGNLMIKHQHNDFPSDIFLLLETVGGMVSVESKNGTQTLSMKDFLKLDMKSKIITKVVIPPYNEKEMHLVTFKIMPRSQNAHAIVNAGFLYKYKSDNKVIEARIVFGDLSPSFFRASTTEKYLIGKCLYTNETLQGALKVLGKELVVTAMPPEPSVEYRKQLALGLFYKGLLTLYPESSLASRNKSGADKLHETRPVSTAKQEYDTDPALWPLSKPMPKLEALIQCSGEAKYSEDIPTLPREVFASFVLSTVATGKIENMDASKALSKPGVVAFYTAKDIPGTNSFMPVGVFFTRANEEIVCSGEVKYYNQPIGIIVAESRALAEEAAKLVEVKYSGTKKPVVLLKTAIKDDKRVKLFLTIPAIDKGLIVTKVLKSRSELKDQYQMCMETLVCVTKPTEQGIEVHTATQWADGTQVMLSRALNMHESRIDVYVFRLGGSYGLKLSRSLLSAMACGLVTIKLDRPCRVIQSLSTNIRAVGKRAPSLLDYEVGVDSLGLIQYVNYNLYESQGYKANELLAIFTADGYYNCYHSDRWNFKVFEVITDTAKTSWCRAPGTLEAVAMAEFIMEHISYALSIDPVQVRLRNLNVVLHADIKEMYETLKQKSDYDDRRSKVEEFNKNNRWKKRGLRTAFSRWTSLTGLVFDVNISIYQDDGTVTITHGGVDVGQGVNTIAAQVCAHLLKIDINKIQVKGNNTINTINNDLSGGSFVTSSVLVGIEKCCEEMLLRLAPVLKTMPDVPWDKLVKAASIIGVDLHVHKQVKRTDSPTYFIYGVAFAEVEIDVLTGESEIIRVDLLQDAGRSVNPDIDVGQVEGAFMMGQGYFTTESIITDIDTGEILTDRAWNYHVPLARDIPQDFRVYLKKKSMGNIAFLGSKATGEPPICLSVVIALALREAITAGRYDSGIPKTEWFPVDGPLTTERICMLTETKVEDFKFK